MSKDFLYGVYYVQYAFRDSSGYPMGNTTAPDSVADGTTTHAVLMTNPVSFTPPAPTFETVTDKGGMQVLAQKGLPASAFGEASLTLSELDDEFHAHITGTTIDTTTVSGWRQMGSGVNKTTSPSLIVIVSTKAYNRTTGADKWSHWIFPNCEIRPGFPQADQSSGDNPSPLDYTIIPNTSTRDVSGELFSGMGMALENDQDIYLRKQTANPVGLTTYVEAATPANTFIVGYRPVSALVDDSDKVFTADGLVITASSINATTGVVVTTGITQSQKVICIYETLYTPI